MGTSGTPFWFTPRCPNTYILQGKTNNLDFYELACFYCEKLKPM